MFARSFDTMNRFQVDLGLDDEEDNVLLADHLEEVERGFDFLLTPHLDRRVRRLGVRHRNYVGRLMQRGGGGPLPPDRQQILPRQMEQALQRAIREQVLQDPEVQPNDHFLININSNRLRHSYHSARMRVREWMNNDLRAQEVMQQISRLLNSNERFQLDDSFSLHISHIRDPGRGSGNKRIKKATMVLDKLLDEKKSVVKIKNDDELCCARAIVTMKAYCDFGSRDSRYVNLRQGKPAQGREARELHRVSGVPEGPCGLPEIDTFQKHLPDYQIAVLSLDHNYQIIFKGPPRDKHIILIKVGQHYHGCHSLSGFLGSVHFCLDCETRYQQDDHSHHPCKGRKCHACKQTGCVDFAPGQIPRHQCPRCQRAFFGEQCMGNHYVYSATDGTRANGAKGIQSVCNTVRKCKQCNRLLRPHEIETRHVCGTAECPSCKQYCNLSQHQCYIQNPSKLEEKRKLLKSRKRKADGTSTRVEKDHVFVYWDSETMQDTGVHVPNLVCAATSNSNAQFKFEGSRCIVNFLDWLLELGKESKLTVLAHNSQGFDSYLILDELYKQYIVPDQIVNGAKILSLSICGGEIVFKDILCFFQMPLSAFPKAFGLTEQKKGFFPHFFNTPDHQDYVGPLPDKEYYDPQGMSVERAKEFHRWYDAHEPDYVFNFKEELLTYCQSDVALLKGACEVFCQEFQAISGFNPLERCITIASACNLFYRTKHMPEKKLASEPVSGWHAQGKPHSLAALEWLTYLNTKPHVDIRHARNGGEHVIRHGSKTYYVDGYDENTRIVYEFHGCFWHGCPKCYPNRDAERHKMHDQSMRDVYEATRRKEDALFSLGYSVIVMWQCEWEQLKRDDETVRNIVDSFELVSRLQPRDAFFGGRTNAVKLYHVTQEGEKIYYYDFTSLYPWTNKNCLYPVGHPRILYEPGSTDIAPYFGLVKCKILPPHGLYHPVLPHRSGGKLTFPLCRKCVEQEQPKPLTERSHHCVHTEEERCLIGTWPTPELQEAINQGYVIQHVYEVWHFPTNSNTMFSSYVNTFLKMKQEASGWPEWVGDDQDKRDQYVQEYLAKEGVQLEPENIQKNPGRRSLAKMMLNSFWGKYGQQGNKSQVEGISEPSRLHELLNDDTQIVQTLRVMNDEMVEVVYKQVDDEESVQVNINIFVACFTTCWARLKLYREGLCRVPPERVLYFDTDSIIFSHRPGEPTPPTGDHLGEFTSELKPGDHIVEFAAAGPKNYGYQTKDGKVECKVRGFTLNTRGQEQLNFERLKQNVIDEVTDPVDEPRAIPVHNPHKIRRDVNTKQLETVEETKRYKVVFDKRVVDPNTFLSYPYGYTRATLDDTDMDNVQRLLDM